MLQVSTNRHGRKKTAPSYQHQLPSSSCRGAHALAHEVLVLTVGMFVVHTASGLDSTKHMGTLHHCRRLLQDA